MVPAPPWLPLARSHTNPPPPSPPVQAAPQAVLALLPYAFPVIGERLQVVETGNKVGDLCGVGVGGRVGRAGGWL